MKINKTHEYIFTKQRNIFSSLHECSICKNKLEIGDKVISAIINGNYTLNHRECYYEKWKW